LTVFGMRVISRWRAAAVARGFGAVFIGGGDLAGFAEEMRAASGVDVGRCYQCRRCSNACPVVEFMDIDPARMVREILADARETVLSSKMIWLCTSCRACSAACPQGIDVARLIDALRTVVVRTGREAAEKGIARHHREFMQNIRRHGRHRTRVRDLFAVFDRGLALVLRGRLRGMFQRIGDRRGVEAAFRLEDEAAGGKRGT